jgi:hypothetical protein
VAFYNAYGDCCVVRRYVTAEGNSLGKWVHDQRKKFKSGNLTAERINMLTKLHFEFTKQHAVVGAKLTVGVAISKIFKY